MSIGLVHGVVAASDAVAVECAVLRASCEVAAVSGLGAGAAGGDCGSDCRLLSPDGCGEVADSGRGRGGRPSA